MNAIALKRSPSMRKQNLAMLKVDLVEAVRLMDDPRDEEQVAHRWRDFIEQAQATAMTALGARIIHREGDGMLLASPSAERALALSFALHRLLPHFNRDVEERSRMYLRIGMHEDIVFADEHDLHGRGVNLAARLKDLAAPGQTVCSAQMRGRLIDDVDASFEDLGECYLKHMREPVRAFRVAAPGAQALEPVGGEPALPPPDRNELRVGLAVVPFATDADTRAGQAAGEMFADALIAALSCGTHLRLISRLSTRAVADRNMDARRSGALLGARFVLSGRVAVLGRRLMVVAELADAGCGEVVWSDSIHCSSRELLSGESELVAGTASAISRAILQRELERVRSHPLPNLASYSLLLGGTALMHRFGRNDFQRAQACLEALIQRAPRHAEPHAWLARWHVFRAVQGWSDDPRRDWRRALDLCKRARDLDPGSTLALTVEGSVRVRMDKDIPAAMRLYQEALDINPNEPLAHLLLGTAHTFQGDGALAVTCAEQAVSLTPLDPMRFFYDSHAGAAHLTAGNLPRAIELAQRSLRANGLHFSTLRTLAIAQSMAGQLDEARGTVQRLLLHEPGLTAREFLDRSPGGAYDHARRYAQALVQAGLPSGPGPF